MTRTLTKEDCKVIAQAYAKAGGEVTKAARLLGIPRRTAWDRVNAAKDMSPDLFPEIPRAAPPKQTVGELATDAKEKETQASLRAKLKDTLRLVGTLREQIDSLKGSSNMGFTPASWTLSSHTAKKQEHTPVLLTSDFQLGEVIRPEETEAGYGYDHNIFRRRYRAMIDTTIYLSFSHAGKNWNYPGIVYERGGDTLSGGIHDELRETDDLTPIEAVQVAFEEESAGIAKLAEAFGHVDVKTPGAGGNHDRNTFKPRAKRAVAHNYDYLIAFMLANHFRGDKRVTFQTSESFDVFYPVYRQNILLTHGDRLGSGGGQGFIGPLATILRGGQKTIMEQAALGRQVHQIHHGHFHTPNVNDWIVSNGTIAGYSEYAKAFRMRPTPPQQFLLYYHAKRGMVDVKPIILLENGK